MRIALAKKISKSDLSVLIIGESGTGKELLSQSIHNASNRSNQPFIAVNCAAVPDSLLESQLFGYEKGSFTGALREGKKGTLVITTWILSSFIKCRSCLFIGVLRILRFYPISSEIVTLQKFGVKIGVK
ncbi:hypothetical protein B7359_15740 [Clostridioides difficile]|nr:hypothetical protein B7359_15740 [Clostridioides difficile]